MVYSACINLSLGSSKIGKNLKAQLVDTLGVNVGSPILSSFSEIGLGNYIFFYQSFPDSFRGGIKFSDNDTGTLYSFTAINPEELENNNTKASTLAASTATAIMAKNGFTENGTLTVAELFEFLYALCSGKISKTDATTYIVYKDDGTTPFYTITQTGTTRTIS